MESQISNYNIKHPYICISFLLITILYELSPTIGAYVSPIMRIGLIMAWYLFILVFERDSYFPTSLAIFLLLWWCFELLYLFLGISSSPIGNYYLTFCFYDIVIKSVFVYYNFNANEKRIVFYIIYISIIITIVECLLKYYIYGDELLFYLRNRGTLDAENPLFSFVRTDFYNALVFFIGSLFFVYRINPSIILKILSIVGISMAYTFMFTIETRTTSLICSVLLLILVYYKTNKSMTASFLLLSGLLILFMSYTLWLPWLIDIVPERVSVRLSAMINPQNDDEGYLSRFELMKVDINTFFGSISNFLFGVGDHRGHEYWGLIGQHSYILDTLARYGCIGIVYLTIFFKKTYYCFVKPLETGFNRQFAIVCFLIFFFLSVNSVAFNVTIGITLFLLLSTII